MTVILFGVNSADKTAQQVATALHAEVGRIGLASFPDDESYIRIEDDVDGKIVVLYQSLDHPNLKVLNLLLIADALRASGAKAIGLCAPYLAYMRQDKQFKSGEVVTSQYFAKLLSAHFDWLVTVDPHLHRYHALSEIYSIPTMVCHAAPLLSTWLSAHVEAPLLIGPDSESEQWVSEVAKLCKAPYIILEKVRKGPREVVVSLPHIKPYSDRRPVLLDDMIVTARTMLATLVHLQGYAMQPAVCLGVHGLFVGDAYQALTAMKVSDVVTCNTIMHISNAIDVTPHLVDAIASLLGSRLRI